MTINYIRECIEKDISRVKGEYGIDISREIGNVLSGFVSYWEKDKDYKSPRVNLLGIVDGLEEYLKYRMPGHLSLNGTRRSRYKIERIIEGKDKKELWELNNYLNALKQRKPHNSVRQLSKYIPEEWLRGK